MKPVAFDLYRPETVEEVISVLAEYGDEAMVLAGGQSLMAMMNLRVATPKVLIDIAEVEALKYCREADGYLEVGAGFTQAELLARPGLKVKAPLLALALPWVGHYQTRNRGTVCGSIAHADPSAELPLCLASLDGAVILGSVRGQRTLPAAQFQTGMLDTDRAPDELVIAARFTLATPGIGHAFTEVARRHGDFAIAALAAVADGPTLSLGVAGVADRPVVRQWPADLEAIEDALNAFAWELEGEDDIHATARYRRDLVRRLGSKLLQEAKACAS